MLWQNACIVPFWTDWHLPPFCIPWKWNWINAIKYETSGTVSAYFIQGIGSCFRWIGFFNSFTGNFCKTVALYSGYMGPYLSFVIIFNLIDIQSLQGFLSRNTDDVQRCLPYLYNSLSCFDKSSLPITRLIDFCSCFTINHHPSYALETFKRYFIYFSTGFEISWKVYFVFDSTLLWTLFPLPDGWIASLHIVDSWTNWFGVTWSPTFS